VKDYFRHISLNQGRHSNPILQENPLVFYLYTKKTLVSGFPSPTSIIMVMSLKMEKHLHLRELSSLND